MLLPNMIMLAYDIYAMHISTTVLSYRKATSNYNS